LELLMKARKKVHGLADHLASSTASSEHASALKFRGLHA
jgi:hypothetical protein